MAAYLGDFNTPRAESPAPGKSYSVRSRLSGTFLHTLDVCALVLPTIQGRLHATNKQTLILDAYVW